MTEERSEEGNTGDQRADDRDQRTAAFGAKDRYSLRGASFEAVKIEGETRLRSSSFDAARVERERR